VVLKKDGKSQARAGLIKTVHGEIETPAFVPVGTQATVKSLSNRDLEDIGVQIFFVNTYHVYLRPGLQTVGCFGGLHQFIGWKGPLITDSAGFQIFSLGEGRRQGRLKLREEQDVPLVRITEEGVTFRSHLDGKEHFFTPESSIEAQVVLGADIIFALDECIYYPATFEYVKMATERTGRWAERCLTVSRRDYQALYGVIQGGVFENLRQASARDISRLPFGGIAIGGVSVGESKKEMELVLDWVVPHLPEDKPRHLLGVGEIDDIFTLVEKGVDTFDCVMPTRLGRMGHVLVHSSKWTLDITKSQYAKDATPIDENCRCFVCQNYTRAYINHLFRVKELLAYRLATYHNLYFLEKLVEKIRFSIKEGNFLDFKKEWL